MLRRAFGTTPNLLIGGIGENHAEVIAEPVLVHPNLRHRVEVLLDPGELVADDPEQVLRFPEPLLHVLRV